MIIKINEDVESYKESVVMGLTGRQFIFSGMAILVGAGIVLCLFSKIGIMASCYIATPVIIPIALMGYYQMNGMNFFQFFSRFVKSFKAKPLGYHSTENKGEYDKLRAPLTTVDNTKKCRKKNKGKKTK